MSPSIYRLESVPPRRYRVIQWYTGQIAADQVRLMAGNPQFEIVGAVCFHEEKDGKDLGELVGIGPMGIRATRNIDEALAIDADIVLHNPLYFDPLGLEPILKSGKNVISLFGPWHLTDDPASRALDVAARSAGVTMHGAGNMPGMINDVVPTMLSGYTAEVTRVWSRERAFLGNYQSPDVLSQVLGFGQSVAEHGPQSPSGNGLVAMFANSFDQAHRSMADTLGAIGPSATWSTALSNYESVAAPEVLALSPSGLVVAPGTVAGYRYEITSSIDGEPWATTEVEHTVETGLGPQWRSSLDEHEWTVRVSGRPPLEMSFGPVLAEGSTDRAEGLLRLNSARMVNLVPAVVAAGPGVKSFAELPVISSAATRR